MRGVLGFGQAAPPPALPGPRLCRKEERRAAAGRRSRPALGAQGSGTARGRARAFGRRSPSPRGARGPRSPGRGAGGGRGPGRERGRRSAAPPWTRRRAWRALMFSVRIPHRDLRVCVDCAQAQGNTRRRELAARWARGDSSTAGSQHYGRLQHGGPRCDQVPP